MLKVKKSKIPGAGKGLFTTTKIKKEDIVIEYTGEKTTWAKFKKKFETQPEKTNYLFYISKNNCIDAEATLDSLGRYANDAEGPTQVKGLKNNSEYRVIKGKPYIVAIKNIPANSEIYVGYGDEYWDIIDY